MQLLASLAAKEAKTTESLLVGSLLPIWDALMRSNFKPIVKTCVLTDTGESMVCLVVPSENSLKALRSQSLQIRVKNRVNAFHSRASGEVKKKRKVLSNEAFTPVNLEVSADVQARESILGSGDVDAFFANVIQARKVELHEDEIEVAKEVLARRAAWATWKKQALDGVAAAESASKFLHWRQVAVELDIGSFTMQHYEAKAKPRLLQQAPNDIRASQSHDDLHRVVNEALQVGLEESVAEELQKEVAARLKVEKDYKEAVDCLRTCTDKKMSQFAQLSARLVSLPEEIYQPRERPGRREIAWRGEKLLTELRQLVSGKFGACQEVRRRGFARSTGNCSCRERGTDKAAEAGTGKAEGSHPCSSFSQCQDECRRSGKLFWSESFKR